MSPKLEAAPEPVTWLGNRNILVPPGIIPVRRISPLSSRKRTPCRPGSDGEPVCRAGGREWFGDRLFADSTTRDLRASCGSSITVHASCLIGLFVLMTGQPAPAPEPASEPLRMPMFVAALGGSGGADAARVASPRPSAAAAPERPAVRPATRRSAEIIPPAEPPEDVLENEERHSIDQARSDSSEDTVAAVPEGAAGATEGSGATTGSGSGSGTGTGTGTGSGRNGVGGGSSGIALSPGLYRAGQGVEPPRRIKDVAPIYPPGALAVRAIGTVVIEAIVGADGKVHQATVVYSIPQLDQAALDAVRQWEFAPSRMNGVAVAVIVTVMVRFSLY